MMIVVEDHHGKQAESWKFAVRVEVEYVFFRFVVVRKRRFLRGTKAS